MSTLLRSLLVGALFAFAAAAQPVVTGALNTASYAVPGLPNSGLAQGSMVAIFGRNIGPAGIIQAGTFPLPTTLGGTSAKISVGGQSIDLIMVYSVATQVGAIVPSNTPTGTGQLTVTFNGQTSAGVSVQILNSQFGIFTINQAGSGPAVVQNVNSETDRPVNSILNSARPAQAMILWGTGLGPIQGSDAGLPPAGDLNQPIEVLVGGRPANILYKGRSGCCSAIDQIVFTVPGNITGCYVPLVVKNGNRVSNYTSMSIAPNGGRCSDPFGYTDAELSKLESTGSLSTGAVSLARFNLKQSIAGQTFEINTESASANFTRFTTAQLIASRGQSGGSVSVGTCNVFTLTDSQNISDPIRAVTLDAGPKLTLTGPKGVKDIPKITGGSYSATLSSSIPNIPGLPGGGGGGPYLDPGTYTTDNATGGVDIGGFRTNLTIPGNFTWTNEASITAIDRNTDLPITWTGSDANGLVFVEGVSYDTNLKLGAAFYCLERGNVGRLTVPSAVMLALPPSAVIQGVPTGQMIVGVTSEPTRFTATGLDSGAFSFLSGTLKSLAIR